MSTVMVSLAVLILTLSSGIRVQEEHKPDPWRNRIERNHMGLHLENEVARQVASDHHRFHAQSIAVVNVCLKILWRVGGNEVGLHPSPRSPLHFHWWWSDATRLATSFSRCNPMWFHSMRLRQGSGLCSSCSRKYPGTEGMNQNRHWNHHHRHATNSLERTRLSCWRL